MIQLSFDMSKGGEDKIFLASDSATENVTLTGYKPSMGGGIQTGAEDTVQIAQAIYDGDAITFGDNKITINGADGEAKITFEDTNATGTTFNLFAKDEEKQAVGFTNKDGGTVNVSTSSADYILVGNWNGKKSDSSTLLGGKGDDTLLGGAGDVLNAGGGTNEIYLNDNENHDGATIILNAGRTTINGLNNLNMPFDEYQGDILQVDLNNAKVSYDTEDNMLKVKGEKFRAEATVEATDGYIRQQFLSDGRLVKAAIAADAETTIDASIGANYYQGEKSAVDFSNFEGTITINLNADDWGSVVDGEEAKFTGINRVQAGEYDSTLQGSDANETLIAGNGDATLYGGGGKNILIGYNEEDRDARTAFFVLGAEDGARNTIQGFTFASDVEDNSLADVLEIDARENVISNVYLASEENVAVEVTNRNGTATETAIIEGAVGKNMYVTDNVIAQVNRTSLTYDGDATFFVATGKEASITVDNENVNNAIIWLGTPERNGNVFIGDIKTVDASGFEGTAELAGNDANNTIYGGEDRNSLWGGNGGDDLIVGGGQNMFFYALGNGNDTISGVKDGDTVYLAAVALEDIGDTEFNSDSITINFSDGGKLQINDGGANVGIVVGEQTYYVNNDRSSYTTEKPE